MIITRQVGNNNDNLDGMHYAYKWTRTCSNKIIWHITANNEVQMEKYCNK